MNMPGQTMTIIIVDGTQASDMMRTGAPSMPVPNGNTQTPNIADNVSKTAEAPKTATNAKQFAAPFMPILNQLTGGAVGQVSGTVEKFSRMTNEFSRGNNFIGGAIVVGELANVIAKIVKNELSKAREKAANENTANLLKIRTGEMQLRPGVYRSNTATFGKIKYNSN